MQRPPGKPDYGLDAPSFVLGLFVGGAALLALAPLLYFWQQRSGSVLLLITFWLVLLLGIVAVLHGVWVAWCGKVGKLAIRGQLLDSIRWRGDERVLDVGCGRGLLLVGAAARLSTGKATGVDIWSQRDQSSNRPEATWKNARIEGVADRIEIVDGDARKLPFDNETFDTVISSLAIHNIPDLQGQQQAIREIVRVVRPGGQILIFDLFSTEVYEAALQACGMLDVQRVRPAYLNFYFYMAARVVTARKP